MFEIRLAHMGDIEEIIGLRLELLGEVGNGIPSMNQELVTENIRNYLQNKLGSDFFCWVAEVDNHIVAISGLNIFEKPPSYKNLTGVEGYIMNIYVDKAHRGKGIATALMKAILSYLEANAIHHVTLLATDEGRKVYEKLGFQSYEGGMKYTIE